MMRWRDGRTDGGAHEHRKTRLLTPVYTKKMCIRIIFYVLTKTATLGKHCQPTMGAWPWPWVVSIGPFLGASSKFLGTRRGDGSLPDMDATLIPWWRRVILRAALVDALLGCSSPFTGTLGWYCGFVPNKESSTNSSGSQRAA